VVGVVGGGECREEPCEEEHVERDGAEVFVHSRGVSVCCG
jgi:hypothetical protein